MTTLDPLHVFLSLLCALTALFYLFRLLHKATWIHSGDAENEVGHGVMAVGMLAMLAPAGLLTPDFIYWNILLFALATLWFIGRLFTRKPLLAMVLRTNGRLPRGVPFVR
ncbi:DUF5134 domain-containing protein [Ktedonobacter racemifer]|uniref:DUF5134 domain-containing protein n=1 Tax=Ktedonobacter racemifer DSM 44963 TaxID=485913 RepID=D6TUS5_KTERA|nr:DUF5134 domain-containing protein [Ktedonobacter racemifer]EFH85251.1 hypothetical protein Krac_6434 [Ktedonobacter racemifer DSM 44963]